MFIPDLDFFHPGHRIKKALDPESGTHHWVHHLNKYGILKSRQRWDFHWFIQFNILFVLFVFRSKLSESRSCNFGAELKI
jgi:hypothetical protein